MIQAITIIVAFVVLFYKTIRLYRYTTQCLQNIIEDETLQNNYRISVDGVEQNNLRLSFFNKLYIYVFVPLEVNKQQHGNYLVQHLRPIDEALQVQNLFGLVESSSESFVSEDGDKKQSIYLVKFYPIVYGVTLWKILLFVSISTLSFFYKEIFELVCRML